MTQRSQFRGLIRKPGWRCREDTDVGNVVGIAGMRRIV
jgi:hypothetical protein